MARCSVWNEGNCEVSVSLSLPPISSLHNQGFDPPAGSAVNGNEVDGQIVWLKERVFLRVCACVCGCVMRLRDRGR